MFFCFYLFRGRERGVLVKGETRRTRSALDVGVVASIFRRVAALPVLTLLPARGNVCLDKAFVYLNSSHMHTLGIVLNEGFLFS